MGNDFAVLFVFFVENDLLSKMKLYASLVLAALMCVVVGLSLQKKTDGIRQMHLSNLETLSAGHRRRRYHCHIIVIIINTRSVTYQKRP